MPMTDPASIEALQASKAQDARLAVHRQAVRYVLTVLDSQPGDATLDYRGLLQRAQIVLATELEQLGD